MNDARLRWQCRRGMRELDVLLTTYLDEQFASAGEPDKAAFRQLLALPDPDLVGYLLGRERSPDAGIANVIDRIRGHASS